MSESADLKARELQARLREAVESGRKGQGAGAVADDSAAPAAAAPSGRPTAASADLLRPASKSVRLLSISIAAAVAAAIAWSSQAVIQEVSVGQGRVVPAGKVQRVQYFEGGIVKSIAVHEGDHVKKGQLLLRMDPTEAGSLLGKNRELLAGLRAKIIRYQAMLAHKPLHYDPDFARAHPLLVAQNRKLYAARESEIRAALAALDEKARQKTQEIRETESRIASLKRAVDIAAKQLALVAPLARDHIVSRAELLAAKARLNDLEGQRDALELSLPRLRAALEEISRTREEKRNSFRSQVLDRLNDTQVKYSALSQSLTADAGKVRRTEVLSPVDGVIKTLFVNTLGQVVRPGGDIAEIVPATDSLLIETRIRPRDIAFLRPGQKAVVKLTSYDYALYGALKGTLERISADSVTDKKGQTYYLADVRTEQNYLLHKGHKLPVIPGMVARVDILTGEKTLFRYITKPLHRMASESFRER